MGKSFGVWEVGQISSPSLSGFLFLPVVGNFLGLNRETENILHMIFVSSWGIKSADKSHLTSLVVDSWVELIGDDSNVWLTVEGGQFDLARGSTIDIGSWGDSNNDGLIRSMTNGDSQRNLCNEVALDSAFDFALDVVNFQGNLENTLVSSTVNSIYPYE